MLGVTKLGARGPAVGAWVGGMLFGCFSGLDTPSIQRRMTPAEWPVHRPQSQLHRPLPRFLWWLPVGVWAPEFGVRTSLRLEVPHFRLQLRDIVKALLDIGARPTPHLAQPLLKCLPE